MKYALFILFTFVMQGLQSQVFTLPLYTGEIPNSNKVVVKESWSYSDILRINGIQTPDITVYLPSKRIATGQAIVICPGGGYYILAYDLEGTDIAAYLNSIGIAAVILKYRLPTAGNTKEPDKAPLMDAQRAMRIVRMNAEHWNINPHEIGIMGFSAGGHLASTLGTHFDSGSPSAADSVERVSCRPDFMVLLYPVISMRDSITHQGSKQALLGSHPDQKMVEYYSNELQVTENTPPAFMVHAINDGAVPVENTLLMAEALRKKHIPVDVHLLDSNRHGFGLATEDPYLASWTGSFKAWLAHINK